MAIKDAKELSMDEILASIRSILHENGNVRPADTEEKRYDVPPVFPVEDRSPVPERPAAACPADTAPVFEPQENQSDTEDDVAAVCNNIQKLMQSSDDEKEARFSISVDDEPLLPEPVLSAEIKTEPERSAVTDKRTERHIGEKDISAEIIDSFAAVFAERRKQKPLIDLSARELAESAVIIEVVPVLAQWLKDRLPDIIRKEIERVTVKAGNR